METLTASLDQVKKTASQTNEQDVQLRALEREAKTERDLLESYLAKYREATARDNINAAPPEARIISRAAPAIKPAFPKKLPTVLIAAFAGFALSAGFIVTGALLAAPRRLCLCARLWRARQRPGAPGDEFAVIGAARAGRYAGSRRPCRSPRRRPRRPRMTGPAALAQIAHDLRQAGEAGRRVAVVGVERGVGTTFAAITLARALAESANVVLVDLAFAAPNLSVISTDPDAPGVADLIHGKASFGDIITRDQYSRLHLVATGNLDGEAAALAASPMLATVVEALMRSYDHVVLDIGAATEIELPRFAPLAPRAVLVTADPASVATRAAQEHMAAAGFGEVSVLVGGAEAVAA